MSGGQPKRSRFALLGDRIGLQRCRIDVLGRAVGTRTTLDVIRAAGSGMGAGFFPDRFAVFVHHANSVGPVAGFARFTWTKKIENRQNHQRIIIYIFL